jgi:hypothetical protein
VADANKECGVRQGTHFTNCPKCQHRIALHCPNCKIQITGCLCTEIDRFGKEAEGIAIIYERMAKQVGDEEARKMLSKAGLWVPPNTELT